MENLVIDKSTKNDVKKLHDGTLLHCGPPIQHEVLKQYGLWIFCPLPSNKLRKRLFPRPRKFEFYGISHLYKGKNAYWTPGSNSRQYNEGNCIITTPGFIHDYGAADTPSMEDALCFAGPLADYLRTSGIIKNGISWLGQSRKLLPIIDLVQEPSTSSHIQANIMLQKLLVDLFMENRHHDNPHTDRITDLIEIAKKQLEKNWSLEEMARTACLSPSQFRRAFKAETSYNPKEFIDYLRIQRGAAMLTQSNARIFEIAASLGYTDQYHFSHRFKNTMGVSPKQYRIDYSRSHPLR